MINEPKHTATPWTDDKFIPIPAGDDRLLLGSFRQKPKVAVRVLSEENFQRAKQCVNACEGFNDPEKEIKIMRELESKFKEDLKRSNERGDSNRKMMVEQSEMNVAMKRELESIRAENAELIEALRATLPILNDVVHEQIDWVRIIVRTTLAKYEKP